MLSLVRRAVDDYRMIDPGDRIAVGISGGKDSLTLLSVLCALKRFYPIPFDIVAITVDIGLPAMDFSPVKALCEQLGVRYTVVKTEIASIIFDVRRESNPCSLCAKMRRGSLHTAALAEGCNKVALGHHRDDVVETFMMNLMFEGRLGCFSPKSFLSNTNLTLIRPLLYAEECDVRSFAERQALPVVTSTCPEDHATERERMKGVLRELEGSYHHLRERIFHAICKGELDGFTLPRGAGKKKDEVNKS